MASAKRFAAIMAAQYKRFLKDNSDNLLAVMHDDDCAVWDFLVVGLGDEFEGGEYVFRLTAPCTEKTYFPVHPPRFEFLTPNGVYVTGGPICISIGEFHAKDAPGKTGSYGWRKTLGMKGFAREVVNGLIISQEGDEKSANGDKTLKGIRLKVVSNKEKRAAAAQSRAFNAKNFADVMARFREFAEAHPELAASQTWLGGGGEAGAAAE